MSKIKILIVEDEALISGYLAKSLKKAGCQITDIAESGEEALHSVEMNPPDIVIMDIELQGKLDGIQTTAEISKTKKLPVIYLTKFSDNTTFRRAKLTNPASYLVKPFNQYDIMNAIELALYNASCAEKNKKVNEHISAKSIYELNKSIYIKNAKNQFIKVEINDILYIQADGVYSSIKTANKDYIATYTLKAICDKIQHPTLVRIHRSFIVNLTKIDSIIGKKIVVLNLDQITDKSELEERKIQDQIPIGDEYKDNLYTNLKCI